MTRLSAHFVRREFACQCGCGADDVCAELLRVLEELRTQFNAPVIITSGRRCVNHNRRCGGAPESQHLSGNAADIRVKGVTPLRVADYLNRTYPDRYGLGRYKNFTHIDVRPAKARWGTG